MVVFRNILLLIIGAVGMGVGVIAGIGIVKDAMRKYKTLKSKGVR